MDQTEFEKGMRRLRVIFKPRDVIAVDEYRRVFMNWNPLLWVRAVDLAIERGTYFPSPGELRGYVANSLGKGEDVPKGCGVCDRGYVYDRTNDSICACDCEAGHYRERIKYGGKKLASVSELKRTRKARCST